jgi:hypothetical protein
MSSDHPIADLLRERLHHDATLVELPDRRPERAAARARDRRRNRRVGLVGGAAVLLVGTAAVLPTLRGSGDTEGDVATEGAGLVPTGPLTLDWQQYAGGPGESWTTFQSGQGVIYALSTAPGNGASSEDRSSTVYRLGDDGTWLSLVLDAGADATPRAIDMSGTDGLLYAVSTGPAAGDPSAAQLSTSGDGGETWATEALPAVAPPNTTHEWAQSQTLAVESKGSTTLALVTTTFSLADPEEVFPELANDEQVLLVESREDGLALVRYEGQVVGEDGRVAAAAENGDIAAAEINPGAQGGREVVRVVPWSELGIAGVDALTPPSQLFRAGADGWDPLDGPGGSYGDLTVAGGRFVALASPNGVPGYGSTARASDDGSTWSDVALPEPGRVVGLDDVLVDVPTQFAGVVNASTDGGLTWEPIDLTAAAGVGAGRLVTSVSGGPLGLALITADPGGTDQTLTVSGDLVDWTTTPLTEATGTDDRVMATVFVGADRMVVRATPFGDLDLSTPPPETVTAVATPTRAG